MYVNQIPSHCSGDCSFTWDAAATPSISGASPSSGSAGDALTIDGSGFGTDTDGVSVKIGGAECDVTTCTDTQIVCNLGEGNGIMVSSLNF